MLKEKVRSLNLDAPDSFYSTEAATLSMMIGGCGPGEFGDRLVPDTIWGLSIRAACAVHDFDYAIGTPKKKADLRFLANMLKIVNTQSKSKILRIMRRYRIMSYYSAVAEGGARYASSKS